MCLNGSSDVENNRFSGRHTSITTYSILELIQHCTCFEQSVVYLGHRCEYRSK